MMNSHNPLPPAQPARRAPCGRAFCAATLALALALPFGPALAEAPPAPAAAPAKAADAPGTEAAAKPALPDLKLDVLPADVVSVTLVGSWSEKHERGVYRVIVVKGGPDELLARVVVQWVRQRVGEKPAVVASREI